MNIKLKAFLLAIVYVASPFVFLYMLFKYPAVILFALLGGVIYLVYNAVLRHLENTDRKKNGYTIKQFNNEYGNSR